MTGWKASILGDLGDCNNWRGITLLSLTSKGPQPHHLQCITEAVESILRQEQVGVRKGRSCTDHRFELCTAITRAVSWVGHCCICCINFEDFEKAFDSIHRESLWKTLRHYGIPQKLIYIIQSLWELRVPSDPQQPSRRALRSEHLSQTRMYFCHLCYSLSRSPGSWGMLHMSKDRDCSGHCPQS